MTATDLMKRPHPIPAFAAHLLAVAALAIVMAGATVTPAAAQERPGPEVRAAVEAVILDQLAAFNAGDHERAYAHAAPRIRERFPTVERFMAMVRSGYEPVYRSRDPLFLRSAVLPDGRVAQEVTLTGPDGRVWTALYTLEEQDDGTWRITGCVLREAPGQGA